MRRQRFLDLITKFGPALMGIALTFLVVRANADYEDGVNAAFEGDFNTAFSEFSIAAEAGLDLAQYNLGILYYTGQGVDQNLKMAFKWTEAAAQQGHVDAQANLASLYLQGVGTQLNEEQGLEWLITAAKNGHGNSALSLANIFFEGEPVERDLVQAHAWAHMARVNQHDEAAAFISKIEPRLDPQQLSSARRLFARWQIEN